MKRRVGCNIILFLIGGLSYGLIEVIWRRYTHWSMILTGGVCFLLLYRVFRRIDCRSVLKKCLMGSGIITGVEFIVGCIVNLWGGQGVWDYSRLPGNLWGQVCLVYSFLWGLLTIPVSFICDKLHEKYHL